jgi:hypothetical protein
MPTTKQPAKPRKRPETTVPAEFRIIEADGQSDFQLIEATGDTENSETPQLRRFTMTAYTGGKLALANFPFPVVADLSGMRIPAKNRPILRDHSVGQIVGHTESIDINRSSIRLKGVISGSNDYAREVAESSGNGFPWQSSIGAQATKVVFVDEGESVEVNGRRFTGPLYVARQSVLREVSFVALGADDRTSATLAASISKARIGVTSMEFEQWLAAQGFSGDDLTEEQTANMTVLYEASQVEETTTAPGDNGNDQHGTSVVASSNLLTEEDADPLIELRAQRAREIRRFYRIAEICKDHADIEARAIEESWDETRAELEVLRASRPTGPAIHSEDGHGSFAEGIEAALCMSAGNISEETCGTLFSTRAMEAALSKSLRGIGLHYLMHNVIRAAGKHVKPGLVDNDFIRAAMSADRSIQAAGGFSTISLSGILSNVANKTMLAAFESVDNVLGRIAAQADANDFKQVTSYRMTGIGEFKKVGPDGELKHGSLGEETFQNQVETYGTILSLNRQMMINDDLGAFLRLPRIIGRQSAIKLQKVGFGLLLANAGAFFSAGNNNYFEGADTNLQISSLTTAEQMFFDQKDDNGDPISITPGVMLVPTSLKTIADQLHNDVTVNETTTANKPKPNRNPHAGKFQPVATPWLNAQSLAGSSGTAWYLLGDAADAAVIEVIYLRGRRIPVIESEETAFNTLGMQWRGYFDFGVALQEKRAGVKSKGAA